MSLTVWWTLPHNLTRKKEYPAETPVIRLTDLRAVTATAREALDRIAHDPNDMEIRRKAEVDCFYVMQQLLAQLKRPEVES